MKISVRLGIGFVLIICMMVSLGITSLMNIKKLASLTEQMYQHPLTVSNAVRDIRGGILEMQRSLTDVVLAADGKELQLAITSLNTHEESVNASFKIVFERFLGDKSDVERAHRLYLNWKPIREEVIALKRQNHRDEATVITKTKGEKYVTEMDASVQILIDFASDKAASFYAKAQNTEKGMQSLMIILIIATLLGAAAIAWFLGRFFSDSMNAAIAGANQMSTGDLTTSFTSNRDDETGKLFAAFNNMQEKWRSFIVGVKADSADLNDTSNDLNKVAGEMLQGAVAMSDKAGSVAEATDEMSNNMTAVSAAAEELSVNMKMVSDNASQSANNMVSVAGATKEMNQTVNEIAQNTEQAREITYQAVLSAKDASVKVDELGAAATEIDAVISAIEEIAEQTKLLSLNATIEAARAGEAGKGFTVVANEVKELANQTSTATLEISKKINAMRNSTTDTIEQIDNISRVINSTNEIVSSIATAVEEQSVTTRDISENIAQASDGIKEMTSAVNEAAQAVQEVNENITQAANSAQGIARDIADVNEESSSIKDIAALLSASAGELYGISHDINTPLQLFHLPPSSQPERRDGPRPLIRFNDSLDVFVEDMNSQHIKIFDYMNQVHFALKKRKRQNEILPILKGLNDYTIQHFANEEHWMESIAYPGLDAQKKAHTYLLDKISDIIKQIDEGQEVNLIEVMAFLKKWLQDHIAVTDKKYGEFCREKGTC
ncbi:MAG: bacteriohemerythrin [Desulfobulbaceae bacterium]|nr:bacteriohemerythrin [Desulfobulbaceae bacterium]